MATVTKSDRIDCLSTCIRFKPSLKTRFNLKPAKNIVSYFKGMFYLLILDVALNIYFQMGLKLLLPVLYLVSLAGSQYTFSDENGIGRQFDGIGGLSGGGVSNHCKFPLFFYKDNIFTSALPFG